MQEGHEVDLHVIVMLYPLEPKDRTQELSSKQRHEQV